MKANLCFSKNLRMRTEMQRRGSWVNVVAEARKDHNVHLQDYNNMSTCQSGELSVKLILIAYPVALGVGQDPSISTQKEHEIKWSRVRNSWQEV